MNSKNNIVEGRLAPVAGLVILVVALFTLVCSGSYLYTWEEDQSALDPAYIFDDTYEIENRGGSIGALCGHFLVGKCFGVSAIVFSCTLLYLSLRLLMRRRIKWENYVLIGLVGSFELSLIATGVALSYGGEWLNMFGGGIGGDAATYVVGKLCVLVGPWVTASIVFVILAFIVVLMLPERVFSNAGRVEAPSEKVPEETPEMPETEPEPEPEPEVNYEPLPDPDDYIAEVEPAGIVEDVSFQEGGDVDLKISGPEEALSTEITEELPQIDVRDDMSRYKFPPSLDILKDYSSMRFNIPQDEIEGNVTKIKNTLASFKIPIESISASVGYTVTLYKICLGEGVRVGQVKTLEDDIAIKIGIKGVRIVMLSDAVGIEVPNNTPSVVPLKAILNSDAFRTAHSELPVGLGYTITTKAKVFDLADAPHLLVAGATKQGKSVGLNAIITSLLYSKHPSELKFVFIDPKMVEFSQYSKLYKHYLAVLPSAESEADEATRAIVKDPKSAEAILRSLCIEMDDRYKLLAAAGVNKITDYNEKYRSRHLNPNNGHKFLPYLVVVIDEYADLTKSTFGSDRNLSRSIENSIIRLAAKGRAAGLHVIIATQRPSVDVITGTIKSNFPTRLAFRTASRQDSMTILGITGAERLIGKGDMLYFSGADAERLQCALIASDEIDSLTSFIAHQTGYKQCTDPYYLPDPGEPDGGEEGSNGGLVDMKNLDPLFEEAARLAVLNRAISTSMIQRKMQLGFARAGRIMDQLEAAGVVGPAQGSKPREALVPDFATLQGIIDAFVK